MSLTRRIFVGIFSIITILFSVLSFERLTMDYNEAGVYFDGVITYNSDAIVGYTALAIISLLITLGLVLLRKNQSRY